ncbi:MAG: hypothetical protein ACTSR8_17410 [Promethearchaeota archaeon]
MQLYKSHGKHCHLRSFPTNCPRCGADVLYWECRHGSKIFFNYPPYGKLIQHRCQSTLKKSPKNKSLVVLVNSLSLSEDNSPCCPVCGKHFNSEEAMELHLKDLSKFDEFHILYSENKISFKLSKTNKDPSNNTNNYVPKFGRINIKKRNK